MTINSNDSTRITVRVTPGAKRNAVSSLKEGVWYIKIAAPPVEGRANEELITYLGRVLDVRKRAIAVLKGQSSRLKMVSVSGLSGEAVNARLSLELRR